MLSDDYPPILGILVVGGAMRQEVSQSEVVWQKAACNLCMLLVPKTVQHKENLQMTCEHRKCSKKEIKKKTNAE